MCFSHMIFLESVDKNTRINIYLIITLDFKLLSCWQAFFTLLAAKVANGLGKGLEADRIWP